MVTIRYYSTKLIENKGFIHIEGGYQNYLRSYKWRKLRNRRIGYDNYTCQICKTKCSNRKGKGFNVHHKSYKNLGTKKEFWDLRTLCKNCHNKMHKIK